MGGSAFPSHPSYVSSTTKRPGFTSGRISAARTAPQLTLKCFPISWDVLDLKVFTNYHQCCDSPTTSRAFSPSRFSPTSLDTQPSCALLPPTLALSSRGTIGDCAPARLPWPCQMCCQNARLGTLCTLCSISSIIWPLSAIEKKTNLVHPYTQCTYKHLQIRHLPSCKTRTRIHPWRDKPESQKVGGQSISRRVSWI